MKNVKLILTLWICISYMLVSYTSLGNEILCFHQSGYTNFESLLENNECANVFDIIENENKKITFEHCTLDGCSDINVLNNIFSNSKQLLDKEHLKLREINLIKYLPLLEKKNFEEMNNVFFIHSEKSTIAKYHRNTDIKTTTLIL